MEEGNAVYEERNKGGGLGSLLPKALARQHDSLKTSNSVFFLSLLNLFTLRFRPTRESCSEAVSHRMI